MLFRSPCVLGCAICAGCAMCAGLCHMCGLCHVCWAVPCVLGCAMCAGLCQLVALDCRAGTTAGVNIICCRIISTGGSQTQLRSMASGVLSGVLPESVGALTAVTMLNFRINALSGTDSN